MLARIGLAFKQPWVYLLLLTSAIALAMTLTLNTLGEVNVLDYGAIGSGAVDETTAIQNAINDAAAGKRRVRFPWGNAGIYRLDGPLHMKEGVQLYAEGFNGVYGVSSAHPKSGWNAGTAQGDPALLANQTVTIAINYRAVADLNVPTIGLVASSSVVGLSFVEWNQNPTNVTPDVYQPVLGNDTATSTNPGGTATMAGVTLKDLHFVNNYFPMKLNRVGVDSIVDNIQGNPLSTGFLSDGLADVIFVSRIKWHVNWSEAEADSPNFSMLKWMATNRTCFSFGRNDEIQVSNLFCFSGKVGIQFFNGAIPGLTGGTYGRFVGIGCDTIQTCAQIDWTGGGSVVFTNWDFNAGTYLASAVDTDSCWTITGNQSVDFTIGAGACRGSRGHAINYSPTNAAMDAAVLNVTGIKVDNWGAGATAGKAAFVSNPTNTMGGINITGSTFRAGQNANAGYGIRLMGGYVQTVMTGNRIVLANGAGAVGLSAEQVDWVFVGNRIRNCTKPINSTVTDQFIVSDNILTSNTNASTVTCTTNCRIVGNVGGGLETDMKNGAALTWN